MNSRDVSENDFLHKETAFGTSLLQARTDHAAVPVFLWFQRLLQRLFTDTVAPSLPVPRESLILQFITKCQICSACNLILCLEVSTLLGYHEIIL
jgi:hypothetical protein